MAIPKKIAKGFVLFFLFAFAIPFILMKLGFGKLMKAIVNDGSEISPLSYPDLIHKASADARDLIEPRECDENTDPCEGDSCGSCGS